MGNPYCEKHEWAANHPLGRCVDCIELEKLKDALILMRHERDEALRNLDHYTGKLDTANAEIHSLRRLMGHWSTVDLAVKWQEQVMSELGAAKAEIERLKAEKDLLAKPLQVREEELRARLDFVNLQKDALFKRIAGALDRIQEGVHRKYAPDLILMEVRSYLKAGEASETREGIFPVEGKPGEVCGPCGVAHPVPEKRVDETPRCGSKNPRGEWRCWRPGGHEGPHENMTATWDA